MSTAAELPPCGCYIRVSTEEQHPENQKRLMAEKCAAWGYRPVWYVEKMSGAVNSRPDFARLVGDALSGTLPAVAFWALDRMGRDQAFLLQQFAALEGAGIRVLSATEDWVSRDDDDNRPILLGVASGQAEAERRRIRRRTLAGLERARQEGKVLGRPLKARTLLLEAQRLIASEKLSIREAARRVSRGLPTKASVKGELTAISENTLRRFLAGTWKGLQKGSARPAGERSAAAPRTGGSPASEAPGLRQKSETVSPPAAPEKSRT